MDQIFDRLGNLLRSVFQEGDDNSDENSSSDPDLQDAWDELNDFLKSEEPSTASHARTTHSYRSSTIPHEIEQAFATLGVPTTASKEEIVKAYKTLLLKHHPDRFATDPEKLSGATEKAKRINEAFQRIKAYKSVK